MAWLLAAVVLQEMEAARARAEADKKKAKLSADLERMRQQLAGLAEQAVARQAAVKLELQKAKLEKELELQVSCLPGHLASADCRRLHKAAMLVIGPQE